MKPTRKVSRESSRAESRHLEVSDRELRSAGAHKPTRERRRRRATAPRRAEETSRSSAGRDVNSAACEVSISSVRTVDDDAYLSDISKAWMWPVTVWRPKGHLWACPRSGLADVLAVPCSEANEGASLCRECGPAAAPGSRAAPRRGRSDNSATGSSTRR
jgi:hypothetical protein